MKKEKIKLNEVSLSVITAGPKEGRPVIVLHGFPERAESWMNQIELLSKQGFFVIAPVLRGYGDSDHPESIKNYSLEKIGHDIVELMDHFKISKSFIIGHDWGCAVSWYLISFFQERFEKAILLNAPHWEVFRRHLLSNPKQLLKSWYILAIQLPFLPEWLISLKNYSLFAETVAKSSVRRAYPKDELEALKKEWNEKDSMSSMLNWYRAAKYSPKTNSKREIDIPVTLVWGERDPFVSQAMGQESLEYCKNGELVVFKNVGHWPHYECKEELNALILATFN